MPIYSFKNDYGEGAHPNIIDALTRTNLSYQEGYGDDEYSKEAIGILRKKLRSPTADIHFVSGGTQANLIVLSSMLKPYESVISASTGHINVHEAGAIESTGHKIHGIECADGKLTSELIKQVVDKHEDEHMVKPRVVFISNTTELGSVYKLKELEQLQRFCQSHNLLLYLDGARLGSALCSKANDVKLIDLSKLVDVCYIGGTKNGALFGEAIVIFNNELKKDFRFHLKQKGALLSKGRVIGLEFVELFKQDLYFELAKHANLMAAKLSNNIEKLGYTFLSPPVSNQIFPLLPDKTISLLQKKYGFYIWSKFNSTTSSIRLVTSWATKEEAVDSFVRDLAMLT